VQVVIGDIQQKTSFESEQFDRILASHVLEHLPNLPEALKEIHRLLKPDGIFSAVIPCEGGLANSCVRFVTSRRAFTKKFKMRYGWLIRSEHVNQCDEILEEINRFFHFQKRSFFPLKVPFVFCNLCIGLILKKK
jgi:ubiquinone/menaquinone biosynthesis C-methylase UbiE